MVIRYDPEELHGPNGPEEVVRGYDTLRRLLTGWVTRTYAMDEDDAAAIFERACGTYFTVRGVVRDAWAWVIGAVIHLAETHQRHHGLPGKTSDFAAEITRIRGLALTSEALEGLPEDVHGAIRMRYFEGRSYVEIAEEMGLAPRYAEKLVAEGVARLSVVRRQQRVEEK